MSNTASGKVKGGALHSRLQFVRDHKGDEGVKNVLARLDEADRKTCASILTGAWYPFDLNDRLDQAIADVMGMGDQVFLLMGEKSATHNLSSAHRAFVVGKDPQGMLERVAQIYQAYYDTGHRTYEKLGEKKAVFRTHESSTFSKHDCLTVVGWHRKAIEMCGGVNPKVTETKCRTRGADVCEYVCEWS